MVFSTGIFSQRTRNLKYKYLVDNANLHLVQLPIVGLVRIARLS